jgi:hypothetical protein
MMAQLDFDCKMLDETHESQPLSVLNAAGQDLDQRALVNMLRHLLSATPTGPSPVLRAMVKHKLVTFTPEDDRALADWSMSQGRAAHLLRRILFHEPTLKLVAAKARNWWNSTDEVTAPKPEGAFTFGSRELTQQAAEEKLRTLRTELKSLAHASTAGLILPNDPGLPKLPRLR